MRNLVSVLCVVSAWSFAMTITYGLALSGEPQSVGFFRLLGFDI